MHNPLSVTFVNGYSGQFLCTTLLPALPHPGDHLSLGNLAYQVTGCDWQLFADGRVHIQVILLPGLNAEGERPFSYPEERGLAAQWAAASTAPSQE
ncbi:MAG TPA: hypothetical protein PLD25_30490 [Chloroflexota bacterium]|nr:hypothetical protein [Chloroflexota bacterium]HUM68188.1 hypothetical protein [Chloroflexota bacterium]